MMTAGPDRPCLPSCFLTECTSHGLSDTGRSIIPHGDRYPDRFGRVIAFSVARSPARRFATEGAQQLLPRFYLAAGTVGAEKIFGKHTARLAKTLQKRGID